MENCIFFFFFFLSGHIFDLINVSNNISKLSNILNNNDISLYFYYISIFSTNLFSIVFKNCKFISYLDLSHNQIGNDGIESFVNVLEEEECKTILSLNLSNNKISDIGANSLARLLSRKCKSIVCLKLNNNNIESDGINKIKEVYKGKRILKI